MRSYVIICKIIQKNAINLEFSDNYNKKITLSLTSGEYIDKLQLMGFQYMRKK